MLGTAEKFLFVYVVDRDFGFAPNPFHGCCTLATCMARLRGSASVGDWVMGVGGRNLNATGRCVYLMKVTELSTFDDYWLDDRFRVKRPFRNGSSVMMVGDNIYHRDGANGEWIQEDSHHSLSDGSPNPANVKKDTCSAQVLISTHFYYFGSAAPQVELASIGYKNGRNYRKLVLSSPDVQALLLSIEEDAKGCRNTIVADPFDFHRASQRVDQVTGKIA